MLISTYILLSYFFIHRKYLVEIEITDNKQTQFKFQKSPFENLEDKNQLSEQREKEKKTNEIIIKGKENPGKILKAFY